MLTKNTERYDKNKRILLLQATRKPAERKSRKCINLVNAEVGRTFGDMVQFADVAQLAEQLI